MLNSVQTRLGGRPALPSAAPVSGPLDEGSPLPATEGRRRYRNLLEGLVLLGLLLAMLVGVLAWQAGWLGPELRPRELMRLPTEPSPSSPLAWASAPPGATPAPSPTVGPSAPAQALPVPPAARVPAPPAADGGEVSASPPLPSAPAGPAPDTSAPPPVAAARPKAAAPVARFAVEFGPFSAASDADRMERQLNESGQQTVRFRQQTGGTLFAVLIEHVPTMQQAQTLVSALRKEGLSDTMILGVGSSLAVRVGQPLKLHGAVQLARRVRATGHPVRIASRPGKAVEFVIRHGNFVSRREAVDAGAALARLGLPNHVVRVR